jgi:hypothetical protein
MGPRTAALSCRRPFRRLGLRQNPALCGALADQEDPDVRTLAPAASCVCFAGLEHPPGGDDEGQTRAGAAAWKSAAVRLAQILDEMRVPAE